MWICLDLHRIHQGWNQELLAGNLGRYPIQQRELGLLQVIREINRPDVENLESSLAEI